MKEDNPWTTVDSRVVYENQWLRLKEDKVIRPDGREGVYSFFETRVAAAVIALTPEREVYLVGQYRYPTHMYSWEVIEGGADQGETPLDAARRELKEEAGLIAAKWTSLGGEIHMSNCVSSEVGFVFLAEDLSETGSEPDGTEVLQVRRVPFEECMRMVHSGDIKDAFAILALTRAEHYLNNGKARR